MSLNFSDVNYLAVLVGGLVTFFIGGLWYTVLFGKLWRDLQNYTEERVRQMQAMRSPAVFFGGMVVCYLVLAWVIAVLEASFQVDDAGSGALLGFLLWLGPTAAVAMTNHLASEKRIGVYLIDVGCELVYLVFLGVLLAVWR